MLLLNIYSIFFYLFLFFLNFLFCFRFFYFFLLTLFFVILFIIFRLIFICIFFFFFIIFFLIFIRNDDLSFLFCKRIKKLKIKLWTYSYINNAFKILLLSGLLSARNYFVIQLTINLSKNKLVNVTAANNFFLRVLIISCVPRFHTH